MPKVSVIIPMYNRWDLVHNRLMELRTYLPISLDCEIVVVDDCSPELDCITGLSWWKSNNVALHPIVTYRNKENLGFGRTCNNGSKLAKGDILVFLSSDVIIKGNFVDPILATIAEDERVLIGGRLVYWPGGWNEFDINGKKTVVPYAEGWLLASTSSVWKELEGFDKRYGRFDYEDVDLSMNAQVKGIRLKGLDLPFVTHMGGATISTLSVSRIEHTKHNRDVFIEKWKETLSK